MASVRKRADGKIVCDVCKELKSALDFPSTTASTCSDCLTREPVVPEPEPFTPSDVEVDYENPTSQELAARTLARRRLMSFIKRFRPKYMAGWVHEDICRRLERFMQAVERKESPRMVLMMPVRMGKQMADETPVSTPSGWTTHGALKPGDEVFHPDGHPVKVLAISEKTPSNVKVTFTNGSTFYCHENHEWRLFNRSRGAWETVETNHFLKKTRFGTTKQVRQKKRAIYQLPVVSPLQFSGATFTMHPYVLGAWLGDGSAGKPCITGAASDSQIIDKIKSLGYGVTTICTHSTTGVLTTYFSGVAKVEWPGRMTRELQQLGIYTDKCIPPEYQRMTIELRLELLAGLIDTDGVIDKNSRITFTTVSRTLADDVMELCEGLGFRPYIQEVQPRLSTSGIQGTRPCFSVGFQPTMHIPVTLPRKRVLRFALQSRVGLDSVERVEEGKQGNCIHVDSPDGLYVVGRQLTATHNSEIGSRHFAPWALGHHPEWEVIAASGGQNLALTFSRYIRDIMRDPSYKALFPETHLDPSSQSVENWNTTKGGGYMAAGIGTMIVGRGAHILLIDDPCTSAEAADSQVQRDGVWEWYIANALNRLAPGGGVLGIMCMTGDTPVLMADNTEQRLDTLTTGSAVATYDRGHLSSSLVLGLKSNGLDSILKIRMSSGRIVRANGRHPFLATHNGELRWIRARSLTTANKIVTTKVSGVSGKGLYAQKRGAIYLPNAEGTATHTTQKSDGLMGTVLQQTDMSLVEQLVSNTATGSPSLSTTHSSLHRTECAPFAGTLPSKGRGTGEVTSPSTTVTKQVRSEGCCATGAIPESDSLELGPLHWPLPGTSDFTLDDIVSIEPDGVEEVFDVQVERTENFIANGLVSHNTHWNEDDWAGRVQQLSKMDDGGDKFEIVKYPAINDVGDEYILPDESIEQFPPGSTIPPGARMTRPMNTPLHEERYTYKMLMNTKATYTALGQQRWWAALYQQSPSLDDGEFFTKKMFKFYTTDPHLLERRTYQAWDFAITEKQKSDYTVGSTGYVDENNNLHVADVVRFKTDDAFIIADAILDNWVAHGSCATLGFEDGQIWKAVSAVFLRRCEERRLFPPYELLVPLTDKGVRAMPLRGLMQGGKVWFKHGADWWEETRKELTQFLSGGKHDDVVDSLSWLARLALKHTAPKKAEAKPMKSWKDDLAARLRGQSGGHMAA